MLHFLFMFFIVSIACNIHGSQYIKLTQDHIEIPNNFALVGVEAFNAFASLNSFIKTQKKVSLYIKKIVEPSSAELGKLLANSIMQLKYNEKLKAFYYTYDDTAYEVEAPSLTNRITNSIVNTLRAITTFGLRNIKILSDEGTILIQFLKKHQTLEHLSLRHCQIPHESIKELFTSLQCNTKLKEIDLYDSYYEKHDNDCRSLYHCGFLEDADLSEVFAQSLKNNSTLTSLNLGKMNDNGFTPTLLIEALSTNNSLTELCLADTTINRENAEIYKKLMRSVSIKTLDLQEAFHRMDVMSECLPVLSNNTVLTKLNLSYHYINSDLAKSIRNHLIINNTTLQALELCNMDIINETEKQEISDLLTLDTKKIIHFSFEKKE